MLRTLGVRLLGRLLVGWLDPVASDDRRLSCVRAFVDDAQMDLSWSEEATALRRGAEEFGPSLDEGLAERDRAGVFDRELWRRCAEFGVLGTGG